MPDVAASHAAAESHRVGNGGLPLSAIVRHFLPFS